MHEYQHLRAKNTLSVRNEYFQFKMRDSLKQKVGKYSQLWYPFRPALSAVTSIRKHEATELTTQSHIAMFSCAYSDPPSSILPTQDHNPRTSRVLCKESRAPQSFLSQPGCRWPEHLDSSWVLTRVRYEPATNQLPWEGWRHTLYTDLHIYICLCFVVMKLYWIYSQIFQVVKLVQSHKTLFKFSSQLWIN